ncbi:MULTISPECIES: hypothetical protein [unclassified Streptomyces]|uniref:hypothetical protein n=1 Tax=unclassified Streptomyces TaxID=2593676 RepID=UPI00068A5F8D|nr:hypothetical protein [Streptomyces sp. NRRL F-5630]
MKIVHMVAARTDARKKARELRLKGWTYDRIVEEVGCSKSSVSLWVRDLPKPEPNFTSQERAREAARARWEPVLAEREEHRRRVKEEARSEIGRLSDRELFLVGVGLYWAEGTKDKAYARRERLVFVNSDPDMIGLFMKWLDLLDVPRAHRRLSLLIHESADVGGAEEFWAEVTGIPRSDFLKTSLKRHNPLTVRKNTGVAYRGCLVVKVAKSADLYRRVEGAWCGIVGGAPRRTIEMSA